MYRDMSFLGRMLLTTVHTLLVPSAFLIFPYCGVAEQVIEAEPYC